jgi:hypothetical protein
MKKLYSLVLFALISSSLSAQLVVNVDTNATQLVNDFILYGVTASNVQYTGDSNALGTFDNGSATNLGIDDGIVMTTGVLNGTPAIGSPVSNFSNTINGTPGDTYLDNLLAGYNTYDASVLEFDFIPLGDSLEFEYVFASEEYPEFVCSSFNDVFGFFIFGPNPYGGNYIGENIALVPGTSLPVMINTVNQGNIDLSYPSSGCVSVAYSSLFVYNKGLGGTSIVFDGFTTVFTAKIIVIPYITYHLKLAIGDAGDGAYDSGIFLKAHSLRSNDYTGIQVMEKNTASIFPSPVTENSVLKFNLSQSGKVIININDYTGRLVQQVIGEYPAGSNSVSIGQHLKDSPSGVYFLNIQTEDGYQTVKILK